jgi:hypothetical protein
MLSTVVCCAPLGTVGRGDSLIGHLNAAWVSSDAMVCCHSPSIRPRATTALRPYVTFSGRFSGSIPVQGSAARLHTGHRRLVCRAHDDWQLFCDCRAATSTREPLAQPGRSLPPKGTTVMPTCLLATVLQL